MALLPFLQGEKDLEEGKDVAGKKIEFAQKLPMADLEGKPAPKGGSFNFLKNPEPRQPGEKAPVKIVPEIPLEKKDAEEEESAFEEESKKENWFSRLLKFDVSNLTIGGNKDSSRVLEVNLVKDEIIKYFDWQRGILIILVAVFSSLAILSGIYWGISWWGSRSENLQSSNYLQQYYKVSKEVSALDARVAEVMSFKAKLEQANFLLARHVYWTNFFRFLEDNTLSNVYFASFSSPIADRYSFAATTDDLDAIDAQVKKLLANPYIKDAEVNSGAIGESGGKSIVSFSIAFGLDRKIFLK
jgi:hypothetical protein